MVQLNFVDSNAIDPNYSVFRIHLVGPIHNLFLSYFYQKINHFTEVKHPNISVF